MRRRSGLTLGGRRRRATSVAGVLLAVVAAAGVWYFREYLPRQTALQAVEGQVLRIVDGDTFEVKYLGARESALVDIAAPETNEPGGPEATEALRRMIDGKIVRLELDSRRIRDKYGRLLAKVYLGQIDVGRKMIADGFAKEYERRR